ncbi:MAG: DUF362 domain-containing protein [Desulfovibrio sp.]|nr:DUF362 domain-containing protein [Desulfovibrio sp.]
MTISRRNFIKNSLITAGILSAGEMALDEALADEGSLFPQHEAIGVGQGIHPGRVVWMHDPKAVHWSGMDFWWKPENFHQGRILEMTRNGIMRLTGEASPQRAWDALFAWRNAKNGKEGGYRPGEKIAIKVNMNGAGENNDDPHGQFGVSYGNPLLLQTLLQSLVRDGGVRPEDIVVYDTCRIFPDYMRAMCTEGDLKGVKFSYRDLGGPNDSAPDKKARIQWAGTVSGEPTYFPTCLTGADYLINLGNLKGHSWGLTLGGKNHFGSFINDDRRTTPAAAGLHPNIINGKMGGYSVLADLMARKEIGGKTMLVMLDGLITAPSETVTITPENSVWTMAPFNGHQASSLFFSQDPVAIDSVGADFLVSEPNMRRHNSNMRGKPQMENYLHEAALLPHPPSKTNYTDGAGGNPGSLGVHGHWNNPEEKLYGRNRGCKEGIELIKN